MNSGFLLITAYALDRAFGEPPTKIHPVAWLGSIIGWGRDLGLNRGKWAELLWGGGLALGIPVAAAASAHGLLLLANSSSVSAAVVGIALLKPTFAARALEQAAHALRDALRRGDLAAARQRLSWLCSRSAQDLSPSQLLAATIESVAENASDSVVAPLFFFACFGIPGAVFYRAVNTLDAMIGYHGRFEYLGKASARLDDVLNWFPARLTAALFLLWGVVLGYDAKAGLRIWRRDSKRTESPNAGRPMATMAGLLGLKLCKVDHYELGEAAREIDVKHVDDACRIVFWSGFSATLLAAAIRVKLHG